jgi:hypothetical protein
MKKVKATHRVALRSFGLDQFGGKSFELARTTIPIKFKWHPFELKDKL